MTKSESALGLSAIALTLLSAPLPLLTSGPTQAGAPVLVIAPPWLAASELVIGSGGRPLGPETAPMAVLAQSEDAEFEAKLRSKGVWFVLDATRITELCGIRVDETV